MIVHPIPLLLEAPVAFDWSLVNTALIVAAIGYLYRQAQIVDQVRQALLGLDGKSGALDEIRRLRERLYELTQVVQTLTTTMELHLPMPPQKGQP